MNVVPCFIDESGALYHAKQPLFAVGLLVVHDVPRLTDQLYTASFNFNARVREKRLALQRDIQQNRAGNMTLHDYQMLLAKTRHHEYKFTGVNTENLQDYISFLNLFFSVSGSEFHAVVIERNEEVTRHLGADSWSSYVSVTTKLLERRLRQPSFLCCDWQTRPKSNNMSLESECCRLPHVSGCIRITSETSPFLQIVDLLLGSISFDWRDCRGFVAPSASSELKRKMVNLVKDKLNMSPTDRFLPEGRSYFNRRSPLRFAAWQADPARLHVQRARGMPRGQLAQGE